MGKLIELGNQYIKESDWKIIAALKFCLISLGILLGINIPEKHRKNSVIVCVPVFLVTYVPLMFKLIRIAFRKEQEA